MYEKPLRPNALFSGRFLFGMKVEDLLCLKKHVRTALRKEKRKGRKGKRIGKGKENIKLSGTSGSGELNTVSLPGILRAVVKKLNKIGYVCC